MSAYANNIEGSTIKGFLKESYGNYSGIFRENENEIYLATDRYFEKYILLTDAGIYEIWAGGYRFKADENLNNFAIDERFNAMNGLKIMTAICKPEQLLTLGFSDNAYFEIGLLAEHNSYNHPERYMKFVK